jgi:hypothetical protein
MILFSSGIMTVCLPIKNFVILVYFVGKKKIAKKIKNFRISACKCSRKWGIIPIQRKNGFV